MSTPTTIAQTRSATLANELTVIATGEKPVAACNAPPATVPTPPSNASQPSQGG